jgi:hypothetical protein
LAAFGKKSKLYIPLSTWQGSEVYSILSIAQFNLKHRADFQTAGWSDMDDSRNLDFLKLIIACGLAVRCKKENDLSRELMTTVEEKNSRQMNSLDMAADSDITAKTQN